jgi:all-beta uncharacterized protein/BACON domain-containing protein
MRNSRSYALGLLLLAVAAGSCDKRSPAEPTPQPCTLTLSTSSLTFGVEGGVASVGIATGAACTWSASSDRAWMTMSGSASGTGNGTVNVSVSPNTTTAERTGTLTVAAQPVTVRQQAPAPCGFELTPSTASFGKDSATGTFAVSAGDQCTWSATSSAPWLGVVSGSPGKGNGTVGYAIERNRELTARAATISIADRQFTVTQAADTGPAPVCEYSVTPVEFNPCMTSPAMTAVITTQPSCTWIAEPDASWITVTSGQSGSGSGAVTFRVSDNWDAPRHSVVKVRWPAITAGQNLQVQQAGCTYAVSAAAIDVAAAGGSGRFDVLQQSNPYTCGGPTQNACMWIARSDVDWITVTTPMPQFGDNPVAFVAAANTGASPRTGRISVRDKVVTITQPGR